MCEFLIFNTKKRFEKQKHFGNFWATFWQLLDTFIGNLWLSLVLYTVFYKFQEKAQNGIWASVTLAGAERAYCKFRLNKSFLLSILIVFLVGNTS